MVVRWTKLNKLHVVILLVIIIVILNWNSLIVKYADRNTVMSSVVISQKAAETAESAPDGLKYILQWTLPDTQPFVFWGTGQDAFLKRQCKVNDCYITHDRTLKDITNYDAIAFHGPEIVRYKPGPNRRSTRQKYVYVSIESSHYYPIHDRRYDDFFNWTWTYRLDSDVPYAYITIRNMNGDIIGPNKTMHWMDVESMKPISDELKERLNSKSKAAAWFVSNCDSKSRREDFVKQLQSELNKFDLEIDVFGKCGKKKCPLDTRDECFKLVEKDYYFYMSLENSFAEDYVTEKLLTALQNSAVPVVYGAANYTRFMPNGTYLHGGQMSPAALAKEMHDIMKDKERYYSFFKWRNHYSYHDSNEAADSDGVCRLCEMLHEELRNTTSYKEFRKWWNQRNAAYRSVGNILQLLSLLVVQILFFGKG